jgi:hypothetical protein
MQIKLAGVGGALESMDHDLGDGLVAEMHRARSSQVEISVKPHERRATVELVRRRIAPVWQASVQMPGQEESAAIGIAMGQASPRSAHMNSVLRGREDSQQIVG